MNDSMSTSTSSTSSLSSSSASKLVFISLDDDEDLKKLLAEMTTTASKKSNTTFKLEDYINDEDFYFARQKPVTNEAFPILIILLCFFCMVSIVTCLIYSCCMRKTRRHPIYSILNQFLFLNLVLSIDVCLKILSSPLVRNSRFYLVKTSQLCTLHQFIQIYVEAVQSFQLLIIWLIILAERSIFPRFRFLYADYENDATTSTSNNNSTFLRRHGRSLILAAFYSITFFLSTLFSPAEVYSYRSTAICMNFSSNALAFIFRLGFFFVFYFPLLYYFIAAVTCFASYFGGERDSLRERLTTTDLDRVRLVKSVTLLRCVIELCTELHTSSYVFLPTLVYETLRVIGFVSILLTTALFVHHEKFYAKLRERLFAHLSLGGGGEPQMSSPPNPSRFIFRGGSGSSQRDLVDSAAVDYTTLVDNEN